MTAAEVLFYSVMFHFLQIFCSVYVVFFVFLCVFLSVFHCRYHLKDVIVGKIYFLLVRIKIKHMEIQIIKRETTGTGIIVKNVLVPQQIPIFAGLVISPFIAWEKFLHF